jgi:ribosomal protein L4
MKSFRNIPRVSVLPATAAGVADIVGAASLVLSQEALTVIESKCGEVARSGAQGDGGAE